jgi:hypothetical protein
MFKDQLFRGTEPEFEYSKVDGYCLYCGNETSVRERFWYVCNVCERVVKSFPSERAASKFVLSWWDDLRRSKSIVKDIKLAVTDPIKLKSYEVPKERKKTRISRPDFTGLLEPSDKQLFGIEMKTGRSSISQMSQFQLDVSDCDDIMGWVEPLRLPGFLFHIQVTEEFNPPTSRRVARDGWFMDIFEMQENFKSIRQRPRENRPAAYYNKKGFHRFDDFIQDDFVERLEEMRKRFAKGFPKLYIQEKSPT